MQYNRLYVSDKRERMYRQATSKKSWIFIIIGIIMLLMTIKYSIATIYNYNETINYTAGGADANTAWNGYNITTKFPNMAITRVDKQTACGAMKIAVFNSTRHLICIFNNNADTSCSLPYQGTYYIFGGNNGSSYTRCFGDSTNPNPKHNGTSITWEKGHVDMAFGTVMIGQVEDLTTGGTVNYMNGSTMLRNIRSIILTYDDNLSTDLLNTINLSSQTPADIDTNNLFNYGHLNITYSFVFPSSPLNASTIRLNWTVINATTWVNGSVYPKYPATMNYTGNTSNTSYYFEIDADNLYPGTYPNYYIEDIEDIDKATYPLSNNHYLNLSLKNVRNDTFYGIFELMVNTTLGSSEIRYCNSSYSGGNPIANANCYLFATFGGTGFNHTHGKSKHNTFSFPINVTNGKIGTVQVTNQSYFLIRGTSVNGTFVGYVTNSTTYGTSYTSSISTDSGATYTPLTLTFDYHLHQYTGTEVLSYFAYASNTTNAQFNSSNTTDAFQQSIVPPTAPIVTNPTTTTYQQYINITYIPSINITGRILYYNISLHNENDTFLAFIYNNSVNTSYYWNTYPNNLTVGQIYKIKILAYDSQGFAPYSYSETFNFSTNGLLNITAFNNITRANVTTFNITLTDLNTSTTTYYNTTNNRLYADIIKNNSYTLLFDASGYAYAYKNITPTEIITRINQSMFITNSFSVNFYDEVTKVLLNGFNVTLDIISDSYAQNYSTMNGTLYFDLISPDIYTFRYDADDGYTERTYYVELTDKGHVDLNLYLINDSTTITINVKDQDDNIVNNAFIKVLRYDLPTNSYTLREIVETNVEGNAYFSGILNEEFYKFIVEYPFGTEVLSTNPDYLRSTSLTLRINLESNPLSTYYSTINTYSTLTFTEATNNFNYYYNDASNTATNGCLYLYRTISGVNTLINSSCPSPASSSGTILLPVANISGYSYTAIGTIIMDGQEYQLKILSQTFDVITDKNTKNNFFFLTIILTAVLSLLFMWNIIIALIVTPIPIFLMSLTGMIPISRSVGVTMLLIGLTLAVVISKKA